jgi:NitT/TauT family transport system substrate-binding protein
MDWLRGLGVGLLVATAFGCAAARDDRSATNGVPAAANPGMPASGEPSAPGSARATPRSVEKVAFALPQAGGNFVPIALAQQKGFFGEEGLEVALPVMRSNLIAASLLSGEVDYSGSAGTSVRNALAGMPVRLIAGTVTKSTRRLMSVPSIESVPQLRGQAIAINSIGGGPHNSGLAALERVGVDPQEVTWLAVGSAPERFVAMQQGTVQASIFSGPEITRAENFGFTTLLRLEDVAPLPEAGVATTTTKLESNGDQVRRTLRAVVRALRYLRADREGSLPVFVQFLGLPPEEAAQAYEDAIVGYSDNGTLTEESLRFTIQTERRQLQLPDEVSVGRVADFGPLYEVLAELGVTPPAGSAR